MRARLGTAAYFCEVGVLKLRADAGGGVGPEPVDGAGARHGRGAQEGGEGTYLTQSVYKVVL